VIRHLFVRQGRPAFAREGDNGAVRRMLSAREREVFQLVAQSHVTQDFARRLSISTQTVCAHMKNICQKLRARTRAQAVIVATNEGLL
jgi:DNA-binding CsgD family transcriptional regulator